MYADSTVRLTVIVHIKSAACGKKQSVFLMEIILKTKWTQTVKPVSVFLIYRWTSMTLLE